MRATVATQKLRPSSHVFSCWRGGGQLTAATQQVLEMLARLAPLPGAFASLGPGLLIAHQGWNRTKRVQTPWGSVQGVSARSAKTPICARRRPSHCLASTPESLSSEAELAKRCFQEAELAPPPRPTAATAAATEARTDVNWPLPTQSMRPRRSFRRCPGRRRTATPTTAW